MKRFTDDELSDIQYEDIVESPYTNAYDLHMGSCDLFALALHDKYGYEMCRIDYYHSFHMFCRTEKDGKIVYIDASGMSSNLQDLQLGQKIELDKVYTVNELKCDGEFDDVGLGFARRLIERYPDYYDVNTIED